MRLTRSIPPIAALLLGALLPLHAFAISDAQHAAISRLGALNGMALKCQRYDETQRMKAAMIATVPKLRALGALFEEATNAGFMQALKADEPCPPQAAFAARVAAGIEQLQKAFAE